MADYLEAPDFGHMAAAALIALVLSFGISWGLDRLFLRRLVKDRIACIAYGCAFVFVLLMAGMTLYLTAATPETGGSVVIPPVGYAICFLLGAGLAGGARMAIYSLYEGNLDEQIVFDPDYSDPSLYDEEVLAWDEKHGHKSYLRRHWVGHLSLPVSYWVNGALLSTLILIAAELLTHKIRTDWGSLRGMAIVALCYIFVSIAVWIWSSVGIWRSAYWHRRRGGAVGWGFAARTLVVVGAVVTVLRSENIALQAAEFGHLAVGKDAIGPVAAMSVSKDGRVLLVRGNLAEGAADKFDALLETSPRVKEIVLTSPGGRLLEAQRMAKAIRNRQLDTRVVDACLSACTNVLLAGRERSADEGAKIGFHQPAFPGWSDAELRRAIAESSDEYLAAGVDQGFVWRAMATPASNIWVPSPDELLAAHVLTSARIPLADAHGHAQPGWAVRSPSDLALYRSFEATAARINAAAPIRLGPLTSLDRATVDGTTFTQFYTLGVPRMSPADKAKLAALSRRDACTDPAKLQAFRAGLKWIDVFRDGSGRTLHTVTVSDCPGA